MLHRFVSLKCLVCRVNVYRVEQVDPLDMNAPEGPVLPSDDWVEVEVLKSSSGWIELAKQCTVSFVPLVLLYPSSTHHINGAF